MKRTYSWMRLIGRQIWNTCVYRQCTRMQGFEKLSCRAKWSA